jgi:trehalose-phosphatase
MTSAGPTPKRANSWRSVRDRHPAAALDRLWSAYRGGASLVLLFDYDGTLVPFAEHPSLATLAPETRALLQRLAGQPRLRLGVLSGRSIDDLKGMVGLPGLYYCGTTGLELDLRGVRVNHPEAARGHGVVEALARRLGEMAAAYPGAWVEKKPFGLTVHYRAVAAHQIERVRAGAALALEPFASRVRVLDGSMGVEVTLALGWTKGSAVRAIVGWRLPKPRERGDPVKPTQPAARPLHGQKGSEVAPGERTRNGDCRTRTGTAGGCFALAGAGVVSAPGLLVSPGRGRLTMHPARLGLGSGPQQSVPVQARAGPTSPAPYTAARRGNK